MWISSPLNVEYEEKLYAAGRIPGSFMRREGRPGERAILTSRVVDRPMRPLFPKEMRNDVCITMTVMSLDPDCSPEIAGMIGASLVTAVSEIPWNGPIGGVQVGLVDGEIVLNPTQEQRKVSDLALTVAATMDKIVMIEAGANEVDEDTMLNAIKAAHVEIKKTIEFINRIVAERGKKKIDFQVVGLDMDVFHAIQNKYLDDFKAAMDTDDKNVRDAALLPIMDKIAEEYAPEIIRYSNGQLVQRTPTEYECPHWMQQSWTISYNTYYLDADNRGCNSCHADMNAMIENMEYKHATIDNKALETYSDVNQCISCHRDNGDDFGRLIHAIHYNERSGNKFAEGSNGTCQSCHDATADGNGMQLWDNVKHEALQGINKVENVQGEFASTQDKVQTQDELYSYDFRSWLLRPYSVTHAGLTGLTSTCPRACSTSGSSRSTGT